MSSSTPYRDKWVSDCGTVTLYLGDCLEILPTLEPGSVDAVVTDPPFGVRTDEKWDDMTLHEFNRFSMQWLAMTRKICDRLASFFASGMPFMELCRYIYPRVRQLIWNKPLGSQYAGASDCRMWYAYEPIAQCWSPEAWEVVKPKKTTLAGMIKKARESRGMSRGGVDIAIRGKRTGLCYRWEESACLPTPEQAEQLSAILGLGKEFRSELAWCYEAKAETLSQMQDAASGTAAALSDVMSYRTVTNGVHPCEKPVALLVDVIAATSDPGETIGDWFSGSGTCGIAAARLSRRYVGIENDEEYFAIAKRRIVDELKRVKFLEPAPKQTQRSLID